VGEIRLLLEQLRPGFGFRRNELDLHSQIAVDEGIGAAEAFLQQPAVELLEGEVHAALVRREVIAVASGS